MSVISFLIGIELKAVKQTQFLNGSQSNRGKNSQVRDHGDQATQAEPGALGRGHFHTAPHDTVGYIVEPGNIYRVNALITNYR